MASQTALSSARRNPSRGWRGPGRIPAAPFHARLPARG